MFMLTEDARAELVKQQYRIVGSHSAVKVCGWTKKMIKGEGGCYKLKFYGIMSNQCMQMTTSMSCANRCTFCWRGYKAPVAKDWKWGIDPPDAILKGSLEAHHKLLTGMKGHPTVVMPAYNRSRDVKHVALSLTGEPITYPRMNELIDDFHSRGISTFLVTNAQYAEQIKNLKPITQLYLSIDAPNKKLLKRVDVPLFPDFWERTLDSLKYLAQKKGRTCIRLTMIKGVNMIEPKNYAKLIEMGDPDFIEVKAYMFIGASRQRLSLENMPYHEDVIAFTRELMAYLSNYEICSEHIPSRVVMVAKKKYKTEGIWHTWIDFDEFAKLMQGGKDPVPEEFILKTPITGISGKGTMDLANARKKRKDKVGRQEYVAVNEDTEESALD